jgi:WD40 repeat protein
LGTLQVWDVASRTLRLTLEGHGNVVDSLSFAADGAELVSADLYGTILRWRLADGSPIEERATDQWVALLPGGWYLGQGDSGEVAIYSTADGKQVLQLDVPPADRDALLVDAAGPTIVTLSEDDLLSRWDLATGALLERGKLDDHGLDGAGLALTPDGATLLQGMGDGSVQLRRTVDGVVIGELRGHDEEVMGISLSPDGTTVAVGSEDGAVTLWRWPERTLLRRLPVKAWWVKGVAFSPDGQLVATVGTQRERAIVKLWRVADGQLLWEQDGGAQHGDVVVFTPDGTTLLAGFWDGSVRQWRVADGTLEREIRTAPRLRNQVKAIVFSPDGRQAAFIYAVREIELWRVSDWTRQRSFGDLVGFPESGAFSPDGQLLVTGSGLDNTVQVWSTTAGRRPLVTLPGHTWSVADVAFSPDQTQLFSAADDGTVRVWSVVE